VGPEKKKMNQIQIPKTQKNMAADQNQIKFKSPKLRKTWQPIKIKSNQIPNTSYKQKRGMKWK